VLQPQSPEVSVEVIDISESQNDPPTKRRKLSRLLDKSRPKEAASSGSESSLTPRQKISCELERYLQTPQLDADDDLLLWWKGNQLHSRNIFL